MGDVREKTIFSIITEAFRPRVTQEQVEKYFQQDDKRFKVLNDFIHGSAQENCLLLATTRPTEGSPVETSKIGIRWVDPGNEQSLRDVEKVLYIIRKNNNPLPNKEPLIAENIFFGTILDDPAMQYQQLLKQIFIPVLKNQNDWGKITAGETSEFLLAAEKFAEVLSESVASQVPKVMLPPPDPARGINTQTISQFKNDPLVIGYCEGLCDIIFYYHPYFMHLKFVNAVVIVLQIWSVNG